MAHKKDYFWTLNMGQIQFSDSKKLESESKHLVLDSGLSYALIPSEDFKILTQNLEKNYGVKCTSDSKKDKFSAQVASSDCTCKDINSIPSLQIQILASADDTKGKFFTMPRETYLKDTGSGKCQLLLNPNDM